MIVPIKNIKNNNYNFKISSYTKTEQIQYGEDVIVKTLGEVCEIVKGSLQSSKNIEGEYTFITASDTNKTHNMFTHDCECVMLVGGSEGSLAKAQYFNGKFIASDLLYILTYKEPNIINYRYLWYYLNNNRKKHLADDKICCGTPKKMISIERCSKIKIPIPSLERQEEIIKDMDEISNSIDTIKLRVKQLKYEGELFKKKFYLKQLNDIFKESEIKTLGEVCEFQNGKRIVKGQVETGEYPVLGGGGFTSFYTNEYSREGKTCKISREGMSLHNCVMLLNEKYYLNSQAFTIKSKNEIIMINEYLWYCLDNNKEQVFKCGRGPAQKAIDIDEFKSIKIPIPTLERQEEIIGIYENITEENKKNFLDKIEQENQHIEMLKKIAISLFNN